MHEDASEIELLRASIAGSAEAFGTIVERYQSLICGITYSSTGDLAKSQELAQETFVRAWRSLSRLEDLEKFRSWLCTIARNLAGKSQRRQRRDVIRAARPLDHAESVAAAEPRPDQIAISNEQQRIVWEALGAIPQTYREPMVLFYREQQSIRKVAAELRLTEETVRQRLSRGRTLLKAEVAALVEDVLGRTGPKKIFTLAVVSALPALAPQAAGAAVSSAAAKGSMAAKSATMTGFLGAVLGPLLGLSGSIVGIRASVVSTSSPREREFQKKRAYLALAYCVGGAMIILLLQWTRMRGRSWPLIGVVGVYLAGIIILAYIGERKHKAIQVEEGTYIPPSRRVRTDGRIIGDFAGAIFGCLVWVHLESIGAKDWPATWLILLSGILIFIAAVRACLRNRRQYYRIAAGMFAAIGLVNLLVVNLRWDKWMAVLGDRPKYRDLDLSKLNVIIGAVAIALILMCFLTDLLQRRIIKRGGSCRG